jgi:hypothetical protein
LGYLFIFDLFVPNPEPLGQEGPSIDEFLEDNFPTPQSKQQISKQKPEKEPITAQNQDSHDYDDEQQSEFQPDLVWFGPS